MCGIDVGVKVEIYCLLGELVVVGKVIIVISSELFEVLCLLYCIVVMCEGCLIGILFGGVLQEDIMELVIWCEMLVVE